MEKCFSYYSVTRRWIIKSCPDWTRASFGSMCRCPLALRPTLKAKGNFYTVRIGGVTTMLTRGERIALTRRRCLAYLEGLWDTMKPSSLSQWFPLPHIRSSTVAVRSFSLKMTRRNFFDVMEKSQLDHDTMWTISSLNGLDRLKKSCPYDPYWRWFDLCYLRVSRMQLLSEAKIHRQHLQLLTSYNPN